MKKLLLFGILAPFVLQSCGGSEEEGTTEGTATDSTEVVAEDDDADIVDPNYLFIGDERGDNLLYGYEDIKTEHAVSLNEFTASMTDTDGFEGVVSITLDKVCSRAGCWVTFKDTNGESVRVLFRDHFTIPTETAPGTEAIIAGHTMWDTLDVHAQAHFLNDENGGVEGEDAYLSGLEDGVVELVFDCDAILIAK